MKRNNSLRGLMVAVIVLGVIGTSATSAQAKMRPRHSVRHHPNYGKRVSLPELIAKAIVVGGLEYYYDHGYFYKRVSGGYIIVDAPVGASVEVIPSGYKVVVINGKTHYYHNDIYFVKRGKKYVVVSDPVYQVVELPQEVQVITNTVPNVPVQRYQTVADTENEFTVNILNTNGSHIPIKIVKSGDGFVGPQGEYYTEFPKVKQLTVMYGK